jgi:hypothetical protein
MEGEYYRWRVQSYIFEDGEIEYRPDPYLTSVDGHVYYPPEYYEMPQYFYFEAG